MNRIFLLLMLAFAAVAAHAQRVFSVVTCPAEDASVAMNVSWATDADAPQSHVIFTESTDKLWRNARRATDVDMHLCTTFDSLWSKTALNEDLYERWRFNKCGTTLKKLKPDTEYMYRVVAGDQRTPIYRFRTAGAKCWSACVISDFHLLLSLLCRQSGFPPNRDLPSRRLLCFDRCPVRP